MDVTQGIQVDARTRPAWGAVFAMALCVIGLIMAELLPVSLLTPMAADLEITQGLAGQAVTATGALAVLTSLLIAAVTRGIDRRPVLLSFSILLIVSNLLVAVAPNLPVLLLGRLLLGVAIGGFWTMAAATAMRLVPEALVPRALSIIFGAVSLATVIAAPLGIFVGAILGWRGVFLIPAALGLFALVWQFGTLPSLTPSGQARLRTLLNVLRRPRMGLGMAAVFLAFVGQFALFTYLRPFLETVTGVGVNGLSAMLLGFGVASFVGSTISGALVQRNIRLTLVLVLLLMSALAACLVILGSVPLATAALVTLWGLVTAVLPVAWSTWITRTIPDEAESGGGLLVATIQLAISVGAAAGGVVFDASGPLMVFAGSRVILLAAAIVISLGFRGRPG